MGPVWLTPLSPVTVWRVPSVYSMTASSSSAVVSPYWQQSPVVPTRPTHQPSASTAPMTFSPGRMRSVTS